MLQFQVCGAPNTNAQFVRDTSPVASAFVYKIMKNIVHCVAALISASNTVSRKVCSKFDKTFQDVITLI